MIGGPADQFASDPEYVERLPDGQGFGAAVPVLCPGVTIYKALKDTVVKAGRRIACSGIGGPGPMAVQCA